MVGQSLPLQVQGPKPAALQNVKVEVEKDATGQEVQPVQQSFLRKYVSSSYTILPYSGNNAQL
jgi:hypothetical protein